MTGAMAASHQVPIAGRNRALDITKALGMIAVVLGHSPAFALGEWAEFKRIIFSFHVPLFFFLAGAFVKESQDYTSFVRSKADSLLKPYVAVLAALGVAKFAISAVKDGAGFELGKYLVGMLYGTGDTIAVPPMWFLPHLFLVSLFTLAVAKCLKSSALQWLLAASSLAMGVFWLHEGQCATSIWPVAAIGVGLQWSVDLLPVTSAFSIAGYLCRDSLRHLQFEPLVLASSAALFAALHYGFDETMDLNMRAYGNFIVTTAGAVLGIYLCLGLSSVLVRFPRAAATLAYVGSGTLFVLMFHSLFEYKVFPLLVSWTGSVLISVVAALVVGIVAPLFLLEIVHRSFWLSRILLPTSILRARNLVADAAMPNS